MKRFSKVLGCSEMYNFFNIQSPLQLMSAISAAEKFNDKKNILLVNLSKGDRHKNDSQIIALLDYDFWDCIIIHRKKNGLIRDFIRPYRLAYLSFKYKGKIDRFFFGEYRDYNMALMGVTIGSKEVILLDDGAFTITAQNYYIKRGLFPYQKKIKKSGKIKKIFSRPNLYSFFDLDLLPYQVNYYDKKPLKRDVNIIKGDLYFFGGKFTERNIMALEDELQALRNVIKKYHDYNVYYIPHRDEGSGKLDQIVGLGYTLKNLGKPAEVFFSETDEMPEIVASYYSTSLYSCFRFFSNVHIVSVNIQNKITKNLSQISSNEIYRYYENLGIEILNVD